MFDIDFLKKRIEETEEQINYLKAKKLNLELFLEAHLDFQQEKQLNKQIKKIQKMEEK